MSNILRNLATVGKDRVEEAVVKSTWDDFDQPKQKHVEALILSSANIRFVEQFNERMNTRKWNVVLKTLIVIHRVCLEGDERFMDDLHSNSHVLNIHHFLDKESIRISGHSGFLKHYTLYLQEKVYTYDAVGTCSSCPSAKKYVLGFAYQFFLCVC